MNKPCVLKSFLTVLLAVCVVGLVLPGPLGAVEPPPTSLSDDGGLTRDSLSDFGVPEPAPAVEPVPVVSPVAYIRAHSSRRVRRRVAHRRAARTSVRVVKSAPVHRGPVVSFVYWWNGWVIRTFHTTDGTVFLKRIGAKA